MNGEEVGFSALDVQIFHNAEHKNGDVKCNEQSAAITAHNRLNGKVSEVNDRFVCFIR